MSVPEVKHALYSMDEKALAPEVIGQLLAFAPSESEVSLFFLVGWLVGFLTSSSTTRLYRGRAPRQSV